MPDPTATAARPNIARVTAQCPCGAYLDITERDGGMGDLHAAVMAWLDRHAEPHDGAPGCCQHGQVHHDQHGCTIDVSPVRRVYERCHGTVPA